MHDSSTGSMTIRPQANSSRILLSLSTILIARFYCNVLLLIGATERTPTLSPLPVISPVVLLVPGYENPRHYWPLVVSLSDHTSGGKVQFMSFDKAQDERDFRLCPYARICGCSR